MKTGWMITDGITSADLSFTAQAPSLEGLFSVCCQAMMSLLLEDIESISRTIERTITVAGADIESLLFAFLQEFLFLKDSESLLLVPELPKINHTGDEYRLVCRARGEKIDRQKHKFHSDIKAVTMHGFSVSKDAGGWIATVVLDV